MTVIRVVEGRNYPGAVIPPELRARLDAGDRPLLRWHLDFATYRVVAWDPDTGALDMERVPDPPGYRYDPAEARRRFDTGASCEAPDCHQLPHHDGPHDPPPAGSRP